MIFFGVDPSSTAVGWSILAPKGGEISAAAFGHFSPSKIAEKKFQEIYGASHSEGRSTKLLELKCYAAYSETKKIIDYYGLNKSNSVAGVEHAAIVAFNARTMEVLVSIGAAAKLAVYDNQIPMISVYPNSWYAMAKVAGLDRKECSRFLTEEIYQVKNATEDECDSMAIAHYVSHVMKERPYLGQRIRELEEGLSDEEMNNLRRENPEKYYRQIFLSRRGWDRKDSFAYAAEIRAYEKRLETYRKTEKKLAISRVKIDGQMKRVSKVDDTQFDRLAGLFDKVKKEGK